VYVGSEFDWLSQRVPGLEKEFGYLGSEVLNGSLRYHRWLVAEWNVLLMAQLLLVAEGVGFVLRWFGGLLMLQPLRLVA
jgi:hypothetical protein